MALCTLHTVIGLIKSHGIITICLHKMISSCDNFTIKGYINLFGHVGYIRINHKIVAASWIFVVFVDALLTIHYELTSTGMIHQLLFDRN